MMGTVRLATAQPAEVLQVGDLYLTIQRSTRRKTLQITVERDGALTVMAPPQTSAQLLRDFVQEKRFWIYTKLAEKEQLHHSAPPKEFVNGEGFLYLGRSHRLKIVPAQNVPLKMTQGRLTLRQDALGNAREHLVRWYSDKARAWLAGRATSYQARMQVAPAGMRVQDLGYRWGSCGKGQWLYFHWKTILLPAPIAEYVVVHEMAHLHEPHHTPTFWQRVERAMPDYERRKAWLAEHGMAVEGL